MVVSLIHHLFPELQKSYDLVSIYPLGIRDFYHSSLAQEITLERCFEVKSPTTIKGLTGATWGGMR
jgi:hypothetical protein